MNLKIECSCGTRYSFEVEPRDGRMPFSVQCPACHADGTATANQIISKTSSAPSEQASRLRIHHTPSEAAPPAAPEAEPPPAPKLDLAAFKAQKRNAEEHAYRKSARLAGGILALVAVCLGVWGWYAFVGSKPQLAGSLKLAGDGPVQLQFLGPDKILMATPVEASLRDLSLEKVLWSTPLSSISAASAAPQIFADHDKLWICLFDQVKCLDPVTGAIKQTVPIAGRFVSFTPADTALLVVSAPDETRRIALHIERSTGAVSSQEISVPRKEQQTMPNDLPPNVLPTAAVLTAQILEEQKFNKPLDAMSSQFFSAGKNLVELRVKLLQAKVTYAASIKPRGPSQLNGQTTAGSSPGPVAEEIFNDLKRSQTGGVRPVDESRYDVRLRRWIEQEPVEWHGEVTGAPAFFPLATVDLLVAGPTLSVFDKQNNKLFDSKLSYPVSERFTTGDLDRLLPAAEHSNTLFFFDQGILTAFSLPSGEVRWRLPSFGISAIQFDDHGMLYVDTSKAGPEDIQYADTISFEKIPPVLLKVDPANGKILWKSESCGERSFISGPYLYSESVQQGGVGMAAALGDALSAPAAEAPVYFHLYRLDPATGQSLWGLYREARPQNLVIERNRILLRFGNNLEVFKFLAF